MQLCESETELKEKYVKCHVYFVEVIFFKLSIVNLFS